MSTAGSNNPNLLITAKIKLGSNFLQNNIVFRRRGIVVPIAIWFVGYLNQRNRHPLISKKLYRRTPQLGVVIVVFRLQRSARTLP